MHRFKISLILSGLVFFSLINWTCTKIDTTNIGSGLIPAVDNVHTFADTLAVIAFNRDSTNTTPIGYLGCDSLNRHRNHPLGYISNDPLFGTTSASFALELKPVGYPYYFAVKQLDPITHQPNDSIRGNKFDSVILILDYVKTWGDSTQPQTIDVSELAPDSTIFRADSTYTTCNPIPAGTLLKTWTFTPGNLSKDTIKAFPFQDSSSNQLRIDLSNTSFAQRLFLLDSSITSANPGFNNDSAYKRFTGGFVLTPHTLGNSISYFNLDGANTKLAIYYHYKDKQIAGQSDTTVAYFVFNPLCGERTSITRNHSGYPVGQPPAPGGDSLIYIETSPGTYATLTIPGLDTLNNRIVHLAELIVDEVPNLSNPLADTLFSPPNYLLLELRDSLHTGGYRTIPCDYVVSNNIPSVNTFGGANKLITDALGTRSQYRFNISRFIQNYITHGRKNVSLRLSAPYHVIRNELFADECGITLAPFNFGINEAVQGRVRVGGGNNSKYKMRLHIVYSKL